jgi:glycosyltransferase involved in cell wall biosynthesis
MAAGHEVTVLATHVGDRERIAALFEMRTQPTLVAVEDGIARLSYEGLTARWLLRGSRMIGRYRPDLVINNGALPFTVPGLSCNLAHDLGWATSPRRLDRLRRLYKRFAYGRCDQVVALCHEVRDGLAPQIGSSPEEIRVIPPCVDVEAYRAAASATREDAILHTGTGGYKDPATTVRAFAALRRSSTRLYVEGEIDDELRQQVAALPVATRDRIELVGPLAAAPLRTLLGSVKVASFPTRYSVPTASATVVEAIAAGTPIVGSTLISADLLEHEANGVACRDDVELTAAYERLLGDDDRWASMSRAALAMAPRFSASQVAGSYLALLENRTA